MDESVLFPCLPYEIGLRCLVRLPIRNRAIASSVSRAWRNAFKNKACMKSLRLSLNLPTEYWIFIAVFDSRCDGDYVHATQHNTQWLLLDPLTLRTLLLSNPLSEISIDTRLSSASTDNQLFLPEVYRQKQGFCSYNLEGREWKYVQHPPGKRCRRFGCAEMNDFIYISGGLIDFTREASRSAFRYDTRRNQWETLPDMIVPRFNCSGVSMNGKFFAIGGYSHPSGDIMETRTSAECFNPQTGEWTLMPNFCGNGLSYAEDLDVSEATFAVVKTKLYTMQPLWNQVMELDSLREQWKHVGYVGGVSQMRSCGTNYTLMGVGSELWAIEYTMGKSIRIYACNPGEISEGSESAEWRQIDVPGMERFDHVLSCTVMEV